MKRNNRTIIYTIAFLLSMAFFACSKKNDAMFAPVLQGVVHGITMQAGTIDTVAITSGKAAFKVDISDTTVVHAGTVGTRLLIAGIKAGKAIVTVTGSDGGKTSVEVTVEDTYVLAEMNDTLRFEQPGQVTVFNKKDNIHIYRDKGITLGSVKNKFGWSSDDGQNFLFLEFSGDPNATGVKTDGSLYTRTAGGAPVRVACTRVEIIQIQSGLIWIVYQQTAGGKFGVVVQKQWIN